MSVREEFRVPVVGGSLGGWIDGSGEPVLLVHGGPGLNFDYLDAVGVELASRFRVASFQQRGLAPSTTEGPFTIAQAIADVVSVLDALGWERAFVAGHSWGGHLVLRFVVAHPERLLGALAVDPLGVVGDGGMAAFGAEMMARTPKQGRDRAAELDELETAGIASESESLEALKIVWPAYFADPEAAPPMPETHLSNDAYAGIIAEIETGLDEVTAGLAATEVPYGVLAGGASPMPWGQVARASVELSHTAFLTVVPAAGHFPWVEAPGCVLAALQRLSGA